MSESVIPKQSFFKKYKLVLAIAICVLLLVLLIIGPILMQLNNGTVENGQVNWTICWIGAIMIAIPVVALAIACIVLLFKKGINNK